MISRIIFRTIVAVVAFFLAALAALAVLFGLGAIWAGDELRAAAPNDPVVRDAAPIFGMLLFAGTVGPALTALPALVAVIAGEVLRVRSWMYYVLAGRLSLAAIPILAAPEGAELSAILASHAMTVFATAGLSIGRSPARGLRPPGLGSDRVGSDRERSRLARDRVRRSAPARQAAPRASSPARAA